MNRWISLLVLRLVDSVLVAVAALIVVAGVLATAVVLGWFAVLARWSILEVSKWLGVGQ